MVNMAILRIRRNRRLGEGVEGQKAAQRINTDRARYSKMTKMKSIRKIQLNGQLKLSVTFCAKD